jgi:hypothetical protein
VIRILFVLSIAPVLVFGQVPVPRAALEYYKTFGGTGGDDVALAAAKDQAGNTYVAGNTTSIDFPVKNALQARLGGANGLSSSDGGASWQRLSIPFPVNAMAASAQRPSVVFAGTSNGIFESTDGGKTWALSPGTSSYNVLALVADSGNPNLITAGTIGGTYQSKDGGMNWTPVNAGVQDVIVLVSDPGRPSTLFSAFNVNYNSGGISIGFAGDVVADDSGSSPSNVYRSIDSGTTWT